MRRSLLVSSLVIGAAILVQYGLARPPGQPMRGGPPNPLLQMFDADHDGTLSAAEIDAAPAKLRERDANKDGKLTAAEMPRGPGGRGGPGGPGFGRGPGGPGFMEGSNDPNKAPLPKDDGEKRILEALQQGVVAPVPRIMPPFGAFSSPNPLESPSREGSSLASMLRTLEARGR